MRTESFWESMVIHCVGDVGIEAVSTSSGIVEVLARGRAGGAVCPDCRSYSDRVHGTYQRRLKDLPLGERCVLIRLTVRRFICGRDGCSRRTFAEPFAQLAGPYQRFTGRLNRESHRVVDVLPTREAGPLAVWLTDHPGVEIICRDRAGAYAEAARRGAPDAVQVADRFHLWQGLGRAVETCVAAAHRDCLRLPTPAGSTRTTPPHPTTTDPVGRRVERKNAAQALVHELLAQGLSRRAVARHLGWGLNTVLRYAAAERWQDTYRGNLPRPSRLDPFKPYLDSRFAAGCTNVTQLHGELVARGAPVTYAMVRAHIATLRTVPAGARPRPPSVRQVTGWLTRHPAALNAQDRAELKEVLARCPELDATAAHLRDFGEILTNRLGARLSDWIKAVDASLLPGLTGFALHLLRDLDAVTACLTREWSSGSVEGAVNRIKKIKRQLY